MLAILALAAGLLPLVHGVSDLRQDLEERVGWLRQIGHIQRSVEAAHDAPSAQALVHLGGAQEALDRLGASIRRSADASVVAALEDAEAGLAALQEPTANQRPERAEVSRVTQARLHTLIGSIRSGTSRVAALLGRRWNQLSQAAFGVVLLALLAIGLTEALVRSAQRATHLQTRVIRDPLTGLLNRAGLQELADRELARTRRDDVDLSVLMVDVDRFKAVNDALGHAVGDSVLVEVAGRLEGVVRPFDLLARVGGDEFLVVLPRCDLAAAERIAERCRAAVAVPFATAAGRVSVTVSIGVTRAAGRRNLRALTEEADRAMYAAKDRGRDACITHESLRRPSA